MKAFRVLIVYCALFFILGSNAVLAVEVIGATPGNGGDSDETTFHFDANNVDFQMTRPDGTDLSSAGISLAYGSALQIFNNSSDFIQTKGLQVLGADLAGANWSNAVFPVQGTVAIDPALGRFKFASPAWERMGFINSTIGGLSGNPAQLVMHSDGSAICVYSQNGSGNGRIYASHYYPATGWQSAVIIDSVDTGSTTNHAYYPWIAMDASGRAICVFTQSGPSVNYRPYANVFLPGVGWQGVTRIDAGQDKTAVSPKVAMVNNKAICVFQQVYNGKERIYANEYTPSTGWEGAITIDYDNTVDNIQPLIAMNDSGRAFCVFMRETTIRTYANEYVPGAGWQGAVAIDAGTTSTNAMDIAMNNSGRAICLAVVVAPGPQLIMHAIEYAPDVGWTAPVVLAASTITAFSGRVSLNQAGQGLVAYVKDDGGNLRIYAREYTSSMGWSSATLIDAGPGQDAINSRVTLNDRGQAVCAFRQSDGTNIRIYANNYAFGLGWSGARLIDGGFGYNATNQEIAINSGGEAFCTWYQYDGSIGRQDVARYRVEHPGGTLQVRYFYNPPAPAVSLPSENVLAIVNRKIEPLQGEKVNIHLALAQAGKTTIKIYTLRGRLVKTLANEYLAAGNYTFDWAALNAGNDLIASGVYIIRVHAPGIDETQKVVVIK